MRKTQVELESRVIRGAHGVAAEEDHIDTIAVLKVGLLSIFIFVVGGIWAWRLQVGMMKEMNPDGQAPIPAALGQYEIGIVNQKLFSQETHAAEKIGAQQKALESGWAEQPGVKARPTISEAMDQIIQERAAGGQQPGQPGGAPTPAPQ
jgi:hypothetical protein